MRHGGGENVLKQCSCGHRPGSNPSFVNWILGGVVGVAHGSTRVVFYNSTMANEKKRK